MLVLGHGNGVGVGLLSETTARGTRPRRRGTPSPGHGTRPPSTGCPAARRGARAFKEAEETRHQGVDRLGEARTIRAASGYLRGHPG